jgi:hypothetical protein
VRSVHFDPQFSFPVQIDGSFFLSSYLSTLISFVWILLPLGIVLDFLSTSTSRRDIVQLDDFPFCTAASIQVDENP